jgi:amidase
MSEGIGYKLALPLARHQELSNFRILLIDTHPLCPSATGVRAALDRLAERLSRTGCSVARASPLLPDLAETARIYVQLLSASSAADLPSDLYQRAETTAKSLPPDAQSLAAFLLRGRVLSHRDWLLATRIRNRLRQQWRDLFQEFDVVLCPSMPTPAFPHDHSLQPDRRLDIDGKQVAYEDQFVWPSIATLTGLPATAAPIDRSDAGLPIGVQILGGYLEDRTTITFAGMIERELGGFTPPPMH